jgi:hypothetical protein
MKVSKKRSRANKNRKQEKGAALITAILLLALILVVSGAIVLATVMSNTSTVDVVAERQAYQAAETGMQMALNVLKGNSTGTTLSFKDAAIRTTSNLDDDWYPTARLSNWLSYTYPTTNPDRVVLTSPYDPYSGLAFSVTVTAPDAVPNAVPTPNPNWIDGPVNKPANGIKPPQPAWHPWHCGHCSWDYTHCSLYNPPNNGTLRADGYGCRHRHCIPPPGWGQAADGGYQRLILRVTGYGPRGAQKQLELMVKRTMFTYDYETLIYLQGSQFGGDLDFNITGAPQITFDGGDKNVAFGTTNDADNTIVQNKISANDKVTIAGKGDDYEVFPSTEWPAFLKTADDARQFMSDLETDAKLRNRWFTTYPINNDGTDSAPELTFVRGDATITSDGNGIIVVTGTLTINSDRHFKGLILVLGGGSLRILSGKTTLEGTIIISKFGATGGFQAPTLSLQGGTVVIKHGETWVDTAMDKVPNVGILSVREN